MEKDLLYGIIAVQLGFTKPGQVMHAAISWLANKSKPLGKRLLDEGALSIEQAQMLELMVKDALKVYGGDVARTIDGFGGQNAILTTFAGTITVDDEGQATQAESSEVGQYTGSGSLGFATEHPDRYEFKSGKRDDAEIGRGAIGRVLVAFDKHLGREIAVKELLKDKLGGSMNLPLNLSAPAVNRFLREARVTGQLEHPNIVPVHEVGASRFPIFTTSKTQQLLLVRRLPTLSDLYSAQ